MQNAQRRCSILNISVDNVIAEAVSHDCKFRDKEVLHHFGGGGCFRATAIVQRDVCSSEILTIEVL